MAKRAVKRPRRAARPPAGPSRPGIPDLWIGVAAFAVAALAAILFRGLAGDEEAFHYLVARGGLAKPDLLLQIAGRPLLSTALVFPAQLGWIPARLMSAVAVGFTGYVVARLARRGRLGSPVWAVICLLLQPFYLAYAGTTMTEPWAAGLIAMGLWALAERRPVVLAVAAGLLPLARLELGIFMPVVALVLVLMGSKRWILLLPLPFVLWNLLGGLAFGDMLWLFRIEPEAYPARELLHYWNTAVWVLGLGIFVPVVVGTVHAIRSRLSKPESKAGSQTPDAWVVWGLLTVVAVLFVVYTVLASIRPVTYGNLRYFAFGAPAYALLATMGIRRLELGGKRELGLQAVGIAVLAALFWAHPLVNDFTILATYDWTPVAVCGTWALLLYFLRAPRRWVPLFVIGLGLFGLVRNNLQTLHLRPPPEQEAMQRAASWVRDPGPALAARHPLMAFYLGKDFYNRDDVLLSDAEFPKTAPPGTVWFWDSHYEARAASVTPPGTLLQQGWSYIGGVVSADSTFAGAFLMRSDGSAARSPSVLALSSLSVNQWLPLLAEAATQIAYHRNLVARDPENEGAWINLAQRYLTMNRHEEALATLDRATARVGETATVLMLRATALASQNKTVEAIEVARRGVALDPGKGLHRYFLGRFLWDNGQQREAVEHVLLAARELTDLGEAQFLAGEAASLDGDWEAALSYYLKALELEKNRPIINLRAASCLVRMNRLEEAVPHFDAEIAIEPSLPEAHLGLASVYEAQGQRDKAVAVLEQGLTATSGHAALLRQLETWKTDQ